MQKTKFKIKGMHCNSCSLLIEEKLKNLPGVIKSKINYESGKGVIIYDENTVNELKIHEKIENAGDYQVEKIEDTEKEKNIDGENPLLKSEEKNNFSHPNLSIPVSIIIAGLIIAGAIIINGGGKKAISTGQTAQVQDQPSPSQAQPNTAQFEPSEQASAVQFDITSENHVRGNFNASITLVEFSDFECPFCVRHYPTLKKILSDYKDKVRLVYKHFPLSFHPNSQKAAEASECADEQSYFWEYHDKLFENFDVGYSIDNFKKWAKELGLDAQQFNTCLDSGKYAQKVLIDSQEGTDKGVDGTPVTFVNSQFVSGALSYESFKQIIDNLLSTLK